jgi:hypothetical protein
MNLIKYFEYKKHFKQTRLKWMSPSGSMTDSARSLGLFVSLRPSRLLRFAALSLEHGVIWILGSVSVLIPR